MARALAPAEAGLEGIMSHGAVGCPLRNDDYIELERRWIDRELALAAGIRRVDSATGAFYMGQKDCGSEKYAGLLIPYTLPGGSSVREWRLRRDNPEMEYKNGQFKPFCKYLSPPGRANMIYFPPNTPPEFLQRKDVPIVITEGEFKTLALQRLAKYKVESDGQRFLPLGLSGVWNWRGIVGKLTGPHGERVDQKGTIPDLDRIYWTGRRVIVAFDADAKENESVENAKKHLARELRMRGAEVAFIEWNIELGKGIDDLLARVGSEEVLSIIEKADFKAPTETDSDITVDWMASAITARYQFAKDQSEKLHVFRDGCYRPEGQDIVHREVKRILGLLGQSARWSSHRSAEVVSYISVDLRTLWERPPLDKINLINGLLNVNTRKLEKHSSDFLSPVQLPIKYDPEARCPNWERFIATTFPKDAETLAWEIVASLMTPGTSIQKAILLLGDGANGKSTYLTGVQAFIGKSNVSAVPLHKLEADRFSVARLAGKLANICPDLPSGDLTSTSIFKALTGGDEMLAERKFQESFEIRPYARLVFSANYLPKSNDASGAFFRRWIVVPFERTFAEGSSKPIPRDKLDAMLADPRELSGVLNKALLASKRLRKNGFTECKSTRRAMEEFRQTTDPLAQFLDRHTVTKCDGFVRCDELLQTYNRDCESTGRPVITPAALGRAIKRLRPNVKTKQRTTERWWVYAGIELIRNHT